MVHRRSRSRCARCLSRLSRSDHHRNHPKRLSPKHSGISANSVLLVVALQYFVLHVGCVYDRVHHVEPEQASSLSSSLVTTPDLCVVPLADDESE